MKIFKMKKEKENYVGTCCVRLHVAKRLTGFKLCTTARNSMQQGVQTDATCNIQHCYIPRLSLN